MKTSSMPLLVSLFCSTTTLESVFSLLVTHLELVFCSLRYFFVSMARGFGLNLFLP